MTPSLSCRSTGWEWFNGLNPHLNDAAWDPDGDGLSNYAEWLGGLLLGGRFPSG